MVGPREMRARVRAIGLTAVAVVLVVALGACGGGSSDDASGGGAGPEATAMSPGGGADGADVPAGDLDCDGAAAAALLAPPTVDSVGWQEQDPDPEVLDEIGEVLPEDLAVAWEGEVVGAVEGEGPTTFDQYMGFVDTVDTVARWIRQQCPDAPPSWTCTTDDGPEEEVPPAPADQGLPATPEEVVAALDDGDAALELDRSDTVVLYGWADETGALERTVRVAQVGSQGWKAATPTTCLDEQDRRELEELMGVIDELDEG